MSWIAPSVLYPATGYNSGYGNAIKTGVNGTRTEYTFFSPSSYSIYFDTSDNKWYDNAGQNPTHFGRNNQAAPFTSNPETLGTWTNNADVLTIGNNSTSQNSSLQMAGWPSGSGGGSSTEGSSTPSGSFYFNAQQQLVFVISSTSPSTDGTISYKIFRRPVGGTLEQAYVVSHTTGQTTEYNIGINLSLYDRWELRIESSSGLYDSAVLSVQTSYKPKVFTNFW